MLSYPSGMTMSSRALGLLSDALRAHRNQRRTRWRKLSPGRQALLVLAHLRKGETYADLAFRMMMQIRNKLVAAYQEVKDLRI